MFSASSCPRCPLSQSWSRPSPALVASPASAAEQVWGYTLPGWNRTSSPAIADVNGDGRADIAHGHQDGWVRVLDATSGNNLPGWPQPVQVRPGIATAVDSSPSIADLDRDGTNEVIVAAGSTWHAEPARRHRGVPPRRRHPLPVRDARLLQPVDGWRRRRPGRRRVLHAGDRRRRRRHLSRHRVRRLGPPRARARPQLPRDLRLPVQHRRQLVVVAGALRLRQRRPPRDLHGWRPDTRRVQRLVRRRVPRPRLGQRFGARGVEDAESPT